jgi:photosystem II stability/assembly factor-like uncharacterized protein
VPETRAAGGGAAPGGLVFVDATKGYATSGGKIFQTLDGGVSWRAVAERGQLLHRLWFVDAQHGFAVGAGGMLLRSDDGGATWNTTALEAGGRDLTSIRCNTSRVCLLTTGSGTELIRAMNAGDTQGTVITPSTDPIYAAAFATPTRVAAAGANGTTVRSDDTGETFATLGGRLRGQYSSIRAGGIPDTAFATGAGGALAKTTDGGRSWATGNVPTTAELLDVAFPTAEQGYALDRDGGLFRTVNGGGSWKTLGTGSTRRPRAVLAPDEDVVLVVGPRGLRRSADAGETFDQVRARAVLRAQLDGVTTTPGGVVFAWGPSVVARSVDGGVSWSKLTAPGRSARERARLRVAQVAFSSASTGLARDNAGRVWRTTNGGRRWALLTAVGTERVIGMGVDSSRAAYLVVDAFADRAGGYLLRTQDAGATWQPQLVVAEGIRPFGLATSTGADYLLAGDASLLFSTTGGVAGSPSELTIATSARQLARPRRITVTGRLQPAGGSAQVTVSALAPGASGWRHQTVSVASNGTFASAWQVPRGTTTFVAQWDGDFKSAGAGSRTMTVTVARRR